MLARFAFAALAVFATGSSYAEDTELIKPAALEKRIAAKDASLVVIDVRTPEEFAAGHVPGAINIPYTYLPARASEVPGDKDVVLYCAKGVRAERAATRFRESGYTRLLHLEGDMTGWTDSKRAIEK